MAKLPRECGVLFILFNVCIAVGTLVTVLAVVSMIPDTVVSLKDTICLPKATENAELACGQSTDVLHEYLNKAIQNHYKNWQDKEETERKAKFATNNYILKQYYEENYWEMIPAAKLTGIDPPEPREGDFQTDMVPIREWKNGVSQRDVGGFVRYGVKYRNGRLVVPVSGTYFVYVFLDFYEECNMENGQPDVNCINKPIKHALYKFNIKDGVDKEIIASVQPHKKSINALFSSYGSYVSSLVELEAGDEISVKVSSIKYLKYTRENYFGLNLI